WESGKAVVNLQYPTTARLGETTMVILRSTLNNHWACVLMLINFFCVGQMMAVPANDGKDK
ncbi:MAG: hypothetical protein KZQ94_20705, partial [Candidatus Thiodiazotropha sp. (ex Troendleina suluensis)]|nr:hypothetical protein [Candidatus Thiodiazotropha sp. (ex Troendleina suluensis)]